MAHPSRQLIVPFASAAASYWLSAWPAARTQRQKWRSRSQTIADPALRVHALETLDHKQTNLEGAVAYAVLAPRGKRAAVIQALVSWQAAYDLADTLSEHSTNRTTESHRLHQLLIRALQPSHAASRAAKTSGHIPDEGAYLRQLGDAARLAFTSLPSHRMTAPAAIQGARRIARYQALHHAASHQALARWASTQTPPDTGLLWWETSAAAASSLPTLAMIAAAAEPTLTATEVKAIEAIYWPSASALHTLLDSLIDLQQDDEDRQKSLLEHAELSSIAIRLQKLASLALTPRERVPDPKRHAILIIGMASLYLSAPEATSIILKPTRDRVISTIGPMARPALVILRARRAATIRQSRQRSL